MLGGNKLREDFSKHAQLLEGVDAFDGQVEVKSGGARGLQKDLQSDLRQLLVEGASDGQDTRKFGAIGGIEIEEEIVGMLLIVAAAGPGIVVDAAQAREVEKRGEVVGDDVLDVLSPSEGMATVSIHLGTPSGIFFWKKAWPLMPSG